MGEVVQMRDRPEPAPEPKQQAPRTRRCEVCGVDYLRGTVHHDALHYIAEDHQGRRFRWDATVCRWREVGS